MSGGWGIERSDEARPAIAPGATVPSAIARRLPVHRRGRWAVLAALASLAAGSAALAAADLEDVVRARGEGNRESQRSQERIDALSDAAEALAVEYRAALEQIDSLRVYNAQLEQLIASQDEEAGSLRAQLDNVTVVARGVTPLMLRMVDALADFVALDLPFLPEERRRRVEDLRAMMRRADVSVAEKYRRILESYQIENEYGRTLEAYQGTLESAGTVRTVDFLRVGRVALVYRTLDGAEVGAWSRKRAAWIVLPDSYRRAIGRGLAMARKREAPDLITLPVPTPESASREPAS